MYHSRRKIRILQEMILETQKDLQQEIKFLQDGCNHPKEQVLECPAKYSPNGFSHRDRPPMRVCKLCGWAEHGYSYFRLKTTDYRYDYEKVSELVFSHNVLGPINDRHTLYHLEYSGRKCDDMCGRDY
jgi:alkylated DNA repair dioxygenase AlkB